ncbi:FAD-dependent oxidoreductase [Acetobacter cerevisiae]|uniref:FAD-dependent oxidoreductase n=1 Tax=Acetobacter cerevisiae TaxID=178900 RepID=UPI001E46EE02|nr:FAD-dependent oxidoreductase [Acetobacter cerevisiae]
MVATRLCAAVTAPLPPPRSVLVLGGGIIARTCALRLQEQECAVTLVAEPDTAPPSWGNAGHIATEQLQVLARFATAPRVLSDHFPRGPVALDWGSAPTWLPWSFRFLRACLPGSVRRGDAALRGLMLNALPAWEKLTKTLDRPEGHKCATGRPRPCNHYADGCCTDCCIQSGPRHPGQSRRAFCRHRPHHQPA